MPKLRQDYARYIALQIRNGEMTLSDIKFELHVGSSRKSSQQNYKLVQAIENFLKQPLI